MPCCLHKLTHWVRPSTLGGAQPSLNEQTEAEITVGWMDVTQLTPDTRPHHQFSHPFAKTHRRTARIEKDVLRTFIFRGFKKFPLCSISTCSQLNRTAGSKQFTRGTPVKFVLWRLGSKWWVLQGDSKDLFEKLLWVMRTLYTWRELSEPFWRCRQFFSLLLTHSLAYPARSHWAPLGAGHSSSFWTVFFMSSHPHLRQDGA